MTLDRLSNGRLVLPVGLGTTDDAAFGNVGEPTEARIRAEKLDESLAILAGLWTGEPFGFSGAHYRFEPMTFRPTPVQQPRIPIWVVGAWPHERSMRRTLAWDGIVAQVEGAHAIREIVEWAEREWPAATRDRPWDVIAEGKTRPTIRWRPPRSPRHAGGRRDVVDRVRLGGRHGRHDPAADRGRTAATAGLNARPARPAARRPAAMYAPADEHLPAPLGVPRGAARRRTAARSASPSATRGSTSGCA